MAGYKVLTIDGLGEVRRLGGLGALSSGEFAKKMIAAADQGFKTGYDGEPRVTLKIVGATVEQNNKLQREYDGAYKRGAALRAKLPPSPAEATPDGPGVPDGVPPGDGPSKPAPKGGGAATIYCAQDSGKGGWRQVGESWVYAHHEGCILSSLAARYLGDAGAWKLIYTGSKERGLLPAGSTPDRIPVRDGSGERVVFWMPPEAIARAKALGCIPADSSSGGGSVPGWAKGLLVAGALGAVLLVVVND